jgi:hypothetical protein
MADMREVRAIPDSYFAAGTRVVSPSFGAEIARLWVGDHLTGVLACVQVQPYEMVETELHWPCYLDGAVDRFSDGDPAHGSRHIIGGHGLDQDGGQADGVLIGRGVGDALDELEELGAWTMV